jgi:hypothetical protein
MQHALPARIDGPTSKVPCTLPSKVLAFEQPARPHTSEPAEGADTPHC